MPKRILILRACGNLDEPHECNGICEQAQLYGIETVCKDVKDNAELEQVLTSNGKFDYIYLSAHGCADSFGSEDDKVDMAWDEFSGLLCSSNCMNEDAILMLSCCRGGLMQVAYTLFGSCTQIAYVLGPRQSLTSADMHICFGVFLYNMEKQNTDPVVACEKIKYGTGQRFSCYDRQEEEMNLDNFYYLSRIGEIYKKVCFEGIGDGEDAEE